MLSKQDKAYLRKEGHYLRPLFQVGKEGLGDNFIMSLSDALTAHELVKISALKTAAASINEISLELASATHSEVVQVIGRTVILYRRSKENKYGL